jgi:hypothetical protein
MPATTPSRPQAVALGLILPLAFVGAAAAQQQSAAPRTAWVDPPPRSAAPVPAQGAGPDTLKAAAAEPPKAQSGVQAQPGEPLKRQARDRHDREPGTEPVRLAARAEASEDALPKAAGTRAPGPKRAAALERPHGREAMRRHAHPAYRLAETPAAAPAPWEVAALSERAAAARMLTARYLATVSGSDDTMVGAATQYYATRVRFYGRPITTAALLAEKRSFVQRWPERRYEPRAMRAACDTETCTIRTRVDFRTANRDRGAVSFGEAELILEVGFSGTRPYILGETGRVLRRSIQAGTLAPSPGKA